MDYKDKYEQALERARIWKDKSGMPKDKQGILDDIFPELAESEDERIRKAIIKVFALHKDYENFFGASVEDILAWLKKQGEQKPTDEEMKGLLRTEYEKGRADAIAEMQKSWSEEDELYIRELESIVKQVWATAEHKNDKDTIRKMSDLSFFLKTLKPQPKQEWSEEDEKCAKKLLRGMDMKKVNLRKE